jgi:enoyl-CoA hydratase/carnithine racemase
MLQSIAHQNILELRLDRPPANALNPALIKALSSALRGAPAEGFGAVVISGRTGFFSGGLDVPELMQLDRAGITDLWRSFFELLRVVAELPIPSIAAITGHSPAGGAVLSLFADYRIMAAGNFRIGLNETQVGLFVPENIQQALRRLVGAHQAEKLMVAGAMIEASEAFRLGFVDELAAPEQVIAQAISKAAQLCALPPQAMKRTRVLARADLIAGISGPLDEQAMTEQWFGEETQSVMREVVKRLKKT